MANHKAKKKTSKGGNQSGSSAQGSATLDAIPSPYNFVPLPDWVYLPEWGAQVSHDLPFRDGLSGEVHYTLTTDTPLLVGGSDRSAPSDDDPGEVKPFYIAHEDRYAVPGSSLKGMLRAVVEIAGFGRMRMVDDARYGVRDLTPGAKTFYGDRMTRQVSKRCFERCFEPRVRAGWLRFDGAQGCWRIAPCEFARVDHDDLSAYSGDEWWDEVKREPQCKKKYVQWRRKMGDRFTVSFDTTSEPERHKHSCGQLIYRRACNLGAGEQQGRLVFTGQPAARKPKSERKPGRSQGKHMEFIFFDEQQETLVVSDRVWQDFQLIHAESEEWSYWRDKQEFPVFYLPDGEGGVESLGLAMMFRVAYEFSIGDMIAHTASEHRDTPGVARGYDLADLLFGAVGEKPADALRGRVSVDTAVAESGLTPRKGRATVLSSPKPTYYPNYVRQTSSDNNHLDTDGYATYSPRGAAAKPEIRGFKRYPARPPEEAHAPKPSGDNRKIQTILHPLPEGTSFQGRLRFHNLRPVELGALLWALTWGNSTDLRHRLGMAKPYGFGQVACRVDTSRSHVAPNDPRRSSFNLDDGRDQGYIEHFVTHMEAVCAERGTSWSGSWQLANLTAMANPGNAPRFKGKYDSRRLRYPVLEGNKNNEFRKAKEGGSKSRLGLVLADYARAVGAIADDAGNAGARKTAGGDLGHSWLNEAVARHMKEHNVHKVEQAIQSKALAERWQQIEDDQERAEVRAKIEELWRQRGLFEQTPGRSQKKAMSIYGWK